MGHCDKVVARLYNFSAARPTDPSLDPEYAEELKRRCPNAPVAKSVEVAMDSATPQTLDSDYFLGLTARKGLFASDQALFEDRRTTDIVASLHDGRRFASEFGEAMRAMGAIGVRARGQIRRNCRKVNTW